MTAARRVATVGRMAHTQSTEPLGTPQVTLENESIAFTSQGIWIQPLLSDGFWFVGDPHELLSILVYHREIDVERARFYVRAGDGR